MQIQLHADRSVARHEATAQHVDQVVSRGMDRFADQITRVEVHLGDTAGAKSNDSDLRCMMEARIANHAPVAVTHFAGNQHQAIDGACDKLVRAVESALGRRQAARRTGAEAGTAEDEDLPE